ncbi:hypothetical protein FRC08_004985 [Ceratobasidium sp. 394]|nr:hypothetical protein FRC08_004985 [Ceratobasidium sp. 394]
MQRSGGGWRFKSCKSGLYLTASDTNEGSEVYSGKYPISWELAQGARDHEVYIIKFAGCDRVFDLCGGEAHNGNRVILHHQWESEPHQKWKLERLNDDAGEEDQWLIREIAERDQQLADKTRQLVDKDTQLMDKDHQLTQMVERLATQSQEAALVSSSPQLTQAQLAEVAERLKSNGQEVDRLQRDNLCAYGKPSGKYTFRDALSQANDTIRDRDIELLKLQNRMLRDELENEASIRQRETGELRENVAKLEQWVVQLSQGIASQMKSLEA